jgi:lipoyl(octanoyl) transferase
MSSVAANQCVVRYLGLQAYQPVWQAMRDFTDSRTPETLDEIWLLEHHPVFTQGQAGKSEHLLSPGIIPVVQSDRGGQITYHGPGQLIAYLLIDLRRLDIGVRALVTTIEASLVAVLARYDIAAQPKAEAPGVYVHNSVQGREAKIAQLGLRVRRGCSFHGLSLNLAMDLEPFSRINPCGYQGLAVTDMRSEISQSIALAEVAQHLLAELSQRLGYTDMIELPSNLQDSYE